MSKNLVIVESPAKASTIEGFLGKDFVVKSSYGHVRDLIKKDLAVDVDNNFAPTYEVSSDKKTLVKDLKKLAKDAEVVWLATDEDREGEAISWHLFEALGLDKSKTKRITFNEITKPAIKSAIENPREINIDLVDAQQARRVLDRLVGFELSPLLWKKIKPSLSAGRVQSVTVRLIVEREREILNFESKSFYRVRGEFETDGKMVNAELPVKFDSEDEAHQFLSDCKDSDFTISNLEVKPAKKSPAAPFITSTLQQEASRKLGFSVGRTMSVAQKLYEAGKITYMRTDSVNLSDTALNAAKKEIESYYGPEYSEVRKYTSKSKGAQEAHEAIRPTYMENHTTDGDPAEVRLYDLIWKRTIASQMADAKLERTKVVIDGSKTKQSFEAKGEVIKFDGFLKVYLEGTDKEGEEEEQKGILPPLSKGQELNLLSANAMERFTHHPARYTEASLVRKLEELGIGRPSTYAPTISTIQKREYVEKGEKEGKTREYTVIALENKEIVKQKKSEITGAEKGKLCPTDIGMVVNDFLVEHFKEIMDYHFTASVEKEFDDIAHGQMIWNDMIKKFYGPFHSEVSNTLETSERATGQRLLGQDPNGQNVYARIGRFGPMVQIGESEAEEKPKFASLRKNQSIGTITLEEAMDLFKLPRDVGEYEGKTVTIGIGRFGPYVRHNSKFVSIKKDQGDDPMTIELDRAIELIEIKRKEDIEKFIMKFDEEEPLIEVLKGRYGPYIKIGKKNVRIPKDVDPLTLTREMCLELEKKMPAKGKGKAKAAAKPKAAAKTKKAAPKKKK